MHKPPIYVRVQEDPVPGHVNGHGELEQEHVRGVEEGQCHQQTHGAASIRQLIQQGAELGAYKRKLIKFTFTHTGPCGTSRIIAVMQ